MKVAWDALRFGPVNLWAVHPTWKMPRLNGLGDFTHSVEIGRETIHADHEKTQRVIADILSHR